MDARDIQVNKRLILLSLFALLGRSVWGYIGYVRSRYLYGRLIIPDGVSDASEYVLLAKNLVYHRVFSFDGINPTTFRAPLYPIFIALFWWTETPPIFVVIVAQCILGAATVGLTYLLARHYFDERVAVIAGVGMALAPLTNQMTGVIMCETLLTFLTTLAIFLWTKDKPKLSGLIFGLAILTKPTILPFVLLFPLIAIFRDRRTMLTMFACAMLIVSAWTIRNVVVLHQFIPVASAGGGVNLLVGTEEIGPFDDHTRLQSDHIAGVGVYDPRRDSLALGQAVERIKNDPLHWIVVRVKQYPRLFLEQGYYLQYGPPLVAQTIRWGFIIGNTLFASLALAGLWNARRFTPLVSFPLFLTLIHFPMWVEPRYFLAAVPMCVICASVACQLKVAVPVKSPTHRIVEIATIRTREPTASRVTFPPADDADAPTRITTDPPNSKVTV